MKAGVTVSTRSKRFVVLVVGILLLSGAGIMAQSGGAPAFAEAVLNTLAALQASVTEIGQDVAEIKDGVGALGTPVNFRFTPPMDLISGFATCHVINVTAESRQLRAQLLSADGTSIADSGLFTSNPGQGGGAGAGGSRGRVYCKFTVEDGTKADIRGSLSFAAGGGTPTLFVVAAE